MVELIFIVGAMIFIGTVLVCRRAMTRRNTAACRNNHKTDYQETFEQRSQLRAPILSDFEIQLPPGLKIAKVKHVIDGDTVIVTNKSSLKKIRLDSIDCPEDGQEWGDIATWGLIKLIGGRKIAYETHDIDRYGRSVATIYTRGEYGKGWVNVNARMVLLGHAWVMRGNYHHLTEARKDELNRMERWARNRKIGLWSGKDPTPPWLWRRDDIP